VSDDASRAARVDDVHEMALAMPHVTVEYGTGDNPVYQVGGKSFIFFRNPRPDAVDPETGQRYADVIVFWVESEADKQALVQDETSPFFTTAHFNGHPSVLVRASRIGELTRRTRGCPAHQRAERQPGSVHTTRHDHTRPPCQAPCHGPDRKRSSLTDAEGAAGSTATAPSAAGPVVCERTRVACTAGEPGTGRVRSAIRWSDPGGRASMVGMVRDRV